MLTEVEKNAYRKLLYWAMLDIRVLSQPSLRVGWNPLTWRKFHLRANAAGAIADWLHNLALHSALEFQRFEPDRFWKDYVYAKGILEDLGLNWRDYQAQYQKDLDEMNGKSQQH
jgi:hypothetical protein